MNWFPDNLSVIGVAVWLIPVGIAARALVVAERTARAADVTAIEERRSADAAKATAEIEQARHHRDLTPEFAITVEQAGTERTTLTLHLVGPPELGRLDEVRVRIDDDHHDRRPTSGLSGEQFASVIWGPSRFAASTDGVDAYGRTVAPFPLSVGGRRKLSLQPSMAPVGQDGAGWRREWSGKPLRLLLECRKGVMEPWQVHWEGEAKAYFGAW